VAAALVGFGLALVLLALRPPLTDVVSVGETGSAGGLSVTVERAAWIGHDMPDQGNVFAMPASMMPGMPLDGQQRLYVAASIANTGDDVLLYGPEQFVLQSDDGHRWPLAGSAVGGVLHPGQRMELDLFFDVDEGAGALSLVWERGDRTVIVPVASAAELEDHDH
jgi:hypothetical protein